MKYLCTVSKSRHRDRHFGKVLYQEKISWSPLLWCFVIFLDASVVLAIWAALPGLATWVTLIILGIGTILANRYSKLELTLTQGWLLVGPAAIERAFIYNFKALNSEEMRVARGINSHPNDYLQLRSWRSGGVKLEIRDPRDKTPTWVFTSKNPQKLVSLLQSVEH
jgi:hypothetical protein